MWKNERYGLIKHFLPFFLPFRFLAKNSEVVSLLEKQFSNFKVWWSTSSSDFEYFNFQLLLKSGINHPIFLEKKEHHYHRNHFYWKRPDWVEILVDVGEGEVPGEGSVEAGGVVGAGGGELML